MSADDQREQRAAVDVLDADVAVRLSEGAYDLSVTTGLSYEQAHRSALEAADLIAAARERDRLRDVVERVRAFAKARHRARCGDEFTAGYCLGCALTDTLEGQP